MYSSSHGHTKVLPPTRILLIGNDQQEGAFCWPSQLFGSSTFECSGPGRHANLEMLIFHASSIWHQGCLRQHILLTESASIIALLLHRKPVLSVSTYQAACTRLSMLRTWQSLQMIRWEGACIVDDLPQNTAKQSYLRSFFISSHMLWSVAGPT